MKDETIYNYKKIHLKWKMMKNAEENDEKINKNKIKKFMCMSFYV